MQIEALLEETMRNLCLRCDKPLDIKTKNEGRYQCDQCSDEILEAVMKPESYLNQDTVDAIDNYIKQAKGEVKIPIIIEDET